MPRALLLILLMFGTSRFGLNHRWPTVALDMFRRTWLDQGDEPIEIRVYRGGKFKATGQQLAKWTT